MAKSAAKIAKANTLSIHERESRTINIETENVKADSLEKTLSRRSYLFANQLENTTYQWKDIRNNLEKKETSISFIDFKYFNGRAWTDTTYYMALVIRPDDKTPQLIKLCLKRDLKKYLNYEKANQNNTYISENEVAHKLYQLIWEPLESYLKKSTTVHYSPSGLLNIISFQTLLDEKGNRLNDIYQLNQYTTLRDFIKQRNQPKNFSTNTIATFGGANFNHSFDTSFDTPNIDSLSLINFQPSLSKHREKIMESWPYLEGTKKEVERISQLSNQSGWKAENYSDTIATEQNFKKLSGNSPRILHIATHGFFLPDPKTDANELNHIQLMGDSYQKNISLSDQPLMRSGLIFTGANHVWKGGEVPEGIDDGVLTSYEIVNLDLRNTELVVLSACDTGLGDIESTEGIFGLQRAFKQAGVDKIIISIWKIPDNETIEFMETFYGYYLNGDSIRAAFIKTQRERCLRSMSPIIGQGLYW